jgi:site-specific DNA-methyltransferase (adenine-specific)
LPDTVIYNQDCVAGMREHVADESVDVIVTSPPYNLGVKYDGFLDEMEPKDYFYWTGRWLEECRRCLSPMGSMFLNVGAKPSDPTFPFQVLQVAADWSDLSYFNVQNVIHWIKSVDDDFVDDTEPEPTRDIRGDIMVGHIKPVNSARFLSNAHEYVFHLTKSRLDGSYVPLDRLAVGCAFADKSNWGRGTRGKNGDIRCRGNVWYIPYRTIKSRDKDRPHPATFPVELAERCIRLHGLDRVGTVMDPFMGIGTTALASVKLGKPVIGFEISEAYWMEAERRLKEAVLTSV